MNEREMTERLRKEAEEHTPDVTLDLDAARTGSPRGGAIALSRRKPAVISILAAVLGIVLLLAILLPVLLPRGGGYATLVISINPSAEFTIEDGKVSKTRPLNRDAAVLLAENDLNGKTAEDACLTFVQLAEKRNLIGADGVRIRVRGKGESSIEQSVRGVLDTLFSVGELDDDALDLLFGSYNEEEMDQFEDYVASTYGDKKKEYLEKAMKLLETYRDDVEELDFSDRAAVESFNKKYILLGEDFLVEDDEDDSPEEIRQELLEEYEEIVRLIERDRDEAFEELFDGFLELMEEDYDD